MLWLVLLRTSWADFYNLNGRPRMQQVITWLMLEVWPEARNYISKTL